MNRRLAPLLLIALLAGLLLGCEKAAEVLSPPPEKLWKEFSGETALAHVEAQVAIGPRPSGSEAAERTRQYIISELEKHGWQVEQQSFTDQTPRGEIRFVNLLARFGGRTDTQRFLLCSHYDTKVYDTIRFVGANDAGSSTGALIEAARVLALHPRLARQVELVFFDGEEAIAQFTATDGLYGSRYYARQLSETGRAAQFQAGILWDMIGDKNLNLTLPPDSPPTVLRGILASADALGYRQYFGFASSPILDDHVPLNRIRIPTVNLIDFDYPYWHTADDSLDKLSPESIRIVAEVTLHWLVTTAEAK